MKKSIKESCMEQLQYKKKELEKHRTNISWFVT